LTVNEIDAQNLKNPWVSDEYRAALNELVDGTDPLNVEPTEARARKKWRNKTDTPAPIKRRTYNDELAGKADLFMRSGTNTPGWVRNIILLRLAMGMTNPLLWGVSIPEMGRSAVVNDLGALFSGYVMGRAARALDSLGGKIEKATDRQS